MKKENIVAVIILAVLALLPEQNACAQCSDVVSGTDAAAVKMAGIRYRNFGTGTGGKIYLGTSLGNSGGRVENAFSRGITCDGQTPSNSWKSLNHVIFRYDPAVEKIFSQATVGDYTYCLEYAVGNLGPGVNYLEINVINRYASSIVDFNNVTLNGRLLGNFTDSDDSTGKNWKLGCSDLSAGFILEGDIILGGMQPTSAETNKVELLFGHSLDSDNDGIPDELDNCPNACNSQQSDADGDGIGDVCDTASGCGGCGQIACEQSCDLDNDGILNAADNCPDSCNTQQLDADGDGIGDACDTVPGCGGCGQIACEAVCTV